MPDQSPESNKDRSTSKGTSETIRGEYVGQSNTALSSADSAIFHLVAALSSRLGNIKEIDTFVSTFARCVYETFHCKQVILLTALHPENAALEHAVTLPPPEDPEKAQALEMLFVSNFNLETDLPLSPLANRALLYVESIELQDTRLDELAYILPDTQFALVPLKVTTSEELIGLLILEQANEQNEPDNLSDKDKYQLDAHLLQMLSTVVSPLLNHTLQHNRTVDRFASSMHEMNILQQIDAELNDTIALDRVFQLIMDWALRFTNASAASIALYDHEADTLTLMLHYGYQIENLQAGQVIQETAGGITLRVARTAQLEMVPDVLLDKDYMSFAPNTRTQLSVPIFREEQVIAVLTLESNKVNGFDESHINFVEKLSNRAGVAVDNARLFTETNRERQKLSMILGGIVDSVVVVDIDQRIVLINQSAIRALGLLIERELIGQKVSDILSHSGFLRLYHTALERNEQVKQELELPNGRIYHAVVDEHPSIGHIIVMQDVTHYKETEQLKNELVATVSHDLKQPLSVMRGYLDLLQMANTFDESSQRYVNQLFTAFHHMRHLIDDILDLARIEAGIELEMAPVELNTILIQAVVSNRPTAENKSIELITDLPHLPPIQADEGRIRQIFNNLISNAVKYTPPEGWVKVYAEIKAGQIRIFIQDNGLGISPEDQAHIFERFYRVRRPETDSIEGTGLGLAIVRSLVEAHKGEITVTSRLGEGSTFRVILPM
ncbi:GAF domain-containing protein [Phototrophicus methaneseepsis]|uniref:histidine kinase n=1 Tax=Phototrophicus methaneseepsis TaxID=2710758 RepID=A0A7S8IE96_9CHLR|nr:ATP-binding protein [Phototrophicus methaneseepsis]QPC81598.1 GAF domain-containing protein [Phototrophicus methaneseepsis]